MEIFGEPKVWIAISTISFVALLAFLGVPSKMAQALDKRSDDIRKELEEARKLREEAQTILADYQKKQREAEQTAEEIITLAKKNAEAYAVETRESLKEALEKRTKLAEEKIARAEDQATAEVRAAAVDVAVAATEELISKKLPKQQADELVNASIKDISNRLN